MGLVVPRAANEAGRAAFDMSHTFEPKPGNVLKVFSVVGQEG